MKRKEPTMMRKNLWSPGFLQEYFGIVSGNIASPGNEMFV